MVACLEWQPLVCKFVEELKFGVGRVVASKLHSMPLYVGSVSSGPLKFLHQVVEIVSGCGSIT